MRTMHSIRFFAVLLAVALAGVRGPDGVKAMHPLTGSPNTPSAPAAVARVTTVTVPPFTPYQEATVHVREEYSGSLGALFTYSPINSYPVSNLNHTANEGVACSHDASLKITCTGGHHLGNDRL